MFQTVALGVACLGALSTCAPPTTTLDQVRQSGVLRVVAVNSPTTCYMGPGGLAGFEYDLSKQFADRLGVQLHMELVTTTQNAIDRVRSGEAHYAAGLTETPGRSGTLRFSAPVISVVPQLVYRAGSRRPESLDTLNGPLVVFADSAQSEQLRDLRHQHPKLTLAETEADAMESLLVKVAENELPYTVANSDLIALTQRFYPQLRIAFEVGAPQNVGWSFSSQRDDSLLGAANRFLSDYRSEGELARVEDRHFGHVQEVDYLGAAALASHFDSRLPRYRAYFEKAASRYGIDWRMLAAIGYQESQWKPDAVSETGVRGIMQLTEPTAAFLKVANREDPAQSIAGGAAYFRQMLDALPETIQEPDRSWLALAAYNMGLGHLYDAQRLTTQLGGDPNRWYDVRNNLPLLTKPKWYAQTRNGYARGYQAIHFVTNIRNYYDMLVWISSGEDDAGEPGAPAPAAPLAKNAVQVQAATAPATRALANAPRL